MTNNSVKRALVTGGAGFIGSYVVRALCERGVHVVVIDDLSTGKRERLAGLEDKITFYESTLFDRDVVQKATEGAEVVFHLAAQVSVAESMTNPLNSHAVNVSGTVLVLEAARAAGVRRVVYSGSGAVYGNQPDLPKNEQSALAPESPYGLTKLLGEEYCRLYTKVFGLETVVLRYMNVFGVGQEPGGSYAGVIPTFVERAKRGESLTIFGDGTQTRDFVYVTDVAEANILAATKEGVSGKTFVIATGQETSLNQLVATIGTEMGRGVAFTYGPARAGDVHRSVGNSALAEEQLGFIPKVSFEEGIRRILNT